MLDEFLQQNFEKIKKLFLKDNHFTQNFEILKFGPKNSKILDCF
jgi:hypothetical protein